MERLSTRVAAVLVLLLLAPTSARAAPLLENGALLDGSGSQPAGWRPDAWSADGSRFGWQTDDDRGMLVIANPVANDARWCQTVAITPGNTYRISAEVRTEDVGTASAGAFISVEPRIGHSRLLDGTSNWQPLDVIVQATGPERQWDVCVRLGSNGSLNTGSAWFRNIAMLLVREGSPAPRGPSLLTLASQWIGRTSWASLTLPLVAGFVLAFGLGLFNRRPRPQSRSLKS